MRQEESVKMNKKKLINQINIYRSVLILLVICVFATILSPSFLSVTNPVSYTHLNHKSHDPGAVSRPVGALYKTGYGG